MLKNIVIIVSSIVFSLVILAIAVSCGSSGPAYVSQLKADGYPVSSQGQLQGGEGIGYAYGCNAGGYGEIVTQGKTDLDAKSLAQQLHDAGVAATSQGDLVSIQGSCDDIHSYISQLGWH